MIFGRRIPSLGPRGEGWVALQFLLLFAIAGSPWFFGATWRGGWFAFFAIGTMLGGLLIVGLAARELRSSLSVLPAPKANAALVVSGIYRSMRHPIYAGLWLVAVGWGVLTYSLPSEFCALLLAVVLDLKARREELFLRERFPEYVAYAARTSRFVPGIY
jgi:protein-S-isoprenylcysteine O-methyltransferase Ste14